MILLLGLAAAHDCSESFLTQTLPVDGAVGVPLDMAPVLLNQWCAESWRFELQAEGQPVVRQELQAGVLARMHAQSLDPDTLYTLTVSPADDTSHTAQIQFTTGSSPAPEAQAPAVVDHSLYAWGADVVFLEGWVAVEPGVVDPLGVLLLLDGSGDVLQAALAQGPAEFTIDEEFVPGVWCVRAAQGDATGDRAHAEPLCLEPEVHYLDEGMDDPAPVDQGVCSSAPAQSMALFASLLMVLISRRS